MKTTPPDFIKVLIVDDEEEACCNLSSILSENTPVNISIVGTAYDTQQAEKIIVSAMPDLVFMDIHMPRENAFEFLSRIGEFSFEIVFVTAFDEYAVKAFKLSAIDYVLKPISIPEIVTALNRTKERLVQKRIIKKDLQFYNKILKQVYSKTSLDQFTFRDKNTVNVVPFRDIIYIEGMGSYSRIFYMANGRINSFVLSHSLAEYEQLLPQELFYRVHKSYLLNRVHVVHVSKDGNPTTLLSDNSRLPVGRRRLSGFLSFLNHQAFL